MLESLCFHDFFSIQRHLEVRADGAIFFPQQFIESGFLQHLIYFLIDSGKNDGNLFSFATFRKSVVQIMNTCGVDERNFTHTDDAYIRTVSQLRHRFFRTS